MSESLESLALEAAGDIDDGKAAAGLSELLRALAGACREREALRAQEPVTSMPVVPGWCNGCTPENCQGCGPAAPQPTREVELLRALAGACRERDALRTRVAELEHLADAAMARVKAA